MRTIAFIAIAMVLVFATIIEAKKSKRCKALNGKKYDIGEGYETTCKKFTCTKKVGRKGQKKRQKMVKTATGNCIEAKKSKRCKALNGKKYDIGEGYETTCKKFTCTNKMGRKGRKKRPRMVKTASGNCCKYDGKQHLQGKEITLPSNRSLSCCKGYWIPFNITSSRQQPACDDDFDPFSLFNGSDANLTQTRGSGIHGGNWMGSVYSWKRLSELSIPGTHDTMSYQGAGATIWHLTQNRDLWKQLNMGVRFIDIRLKIRGGTLGCYHGNAYLDNDFDDVLYWIYWFLRYYPTETVIMRVKNEGSYDWRFCPRLNSILRKWPILRWNSGSTTIKQGYNVPYLSDVRGKLVVLNLKATQGCFGFKFADQDDNTLDNYEGDDNVEWKTWDWINAVGDFFGDVGDFFTDVFGRRRKREDSNFDEDEDIEGFQNQSSEKNVTTEYTKNLRKSGIELDKKVEIGKTEGNGYGNVTTVPSQVPSEEELTSFGVNQTSGVPLNQTRFIGGTWVPSESYKRQLERFMDRARTGYSYDKMLYTTYASAFHFLVHNERFASHVNPRMYTYFKAHRFDRVGIVVFDYINEWNSDMLELIYERNYKQACAIMYEHCDYKGGWIKFWSGDRDSSLSPWNWNDVASSYSVKHGCRLTYYEHGGFTGSWVATSVKRSCLVNGPFNRNWNDRISSVKCTC